MQPSTVVRRRIGSLVLAVVLLATGTVLAAWKHGRLVAERARAAGVGQVVFDRAGFRYHGRIKSLADAAREAGLDF